MIYFGERQRIHPRSAYPSAYPHDSQEVALSPQVTATVPFMCHTIGSLSSSESSTSPSQGRILFQNCENSYAEAVPTHAHHCQMHQVSNPTSSCGSEVEGSDLLESSLAVSTTLSTGPSNCGSPQEQCYAYAANHPEMRIAMQYSSQTLLPQRAQMDPQQLELQTTQHQMQQFRNDQFQGHMQHQGIRMAGTANPSLNYESQPQKQFTPSAGIEVYEAATIPSPLASEAEVKESENKPATTKKGKRPTDSKGHKKFTRKRSQAAFPDVEYPTGNPTEAELALIAQYEPADHIAGVRFSPNKRQWLAAWSIAPGREIRKHFSVVQKGYGEAWKLAVLCRWEAERNGARMRVKANSESKAPTRKKPSRRCSSGRPKQSSKPSSISDGSSSSEDFE